MRILLIGDPHCTEPELKDCQALVDYVCRVARETKPDHIVLLGDLFHTHNIVHLEIQEFWAKSIAQMAKLAHVIIINGNHDSPHHKLSKASANRPFRSIPNVEVVIDELYDLGDYVFAPFCHTEQELLGLIGQHSPSDAVLFCHNTFLGAKYENGLYAKEGWDSAKFKNPLIVSGHIHNRHRFGKVIYPGSPRWRTKSDANEEKGIFLLEFDGPNLVKETEFSTKDVCSPIYSLEDTSTSPLSIKPVVNARYFISIKGSPDWVETRKSLYPWAKVSTFPMNKKIQVKESDGIRHAFDKYLQQFVPKYGTSLEKLKLKTEELFLAKL